MIAGTDDPPSTPPPFALGAVTANAVLMGVAGAVAPMAWLCVPALIDSSKFSASSS